MDLEPRNKKDLKLNDQFSLTTCPDGGIEISRGDQAFELLCAGTNHPYCHAAERFFERTVNSPERRYESKKNIALRVRNKQTFEAAEIVIEATISIKNYGVHSAIILEPAELKGLLCSPCSDDKSKWAVFRPFRPANAKNPDHSHLISPELVAIAVVSNETQFRSIDQLENMRGIDFASKGLVTTPEKSSFNIIRKVIVEEDDIFSPHMIDNKTYKLEVSDPSMLPSPDEDVFIFGESPFSWPQMDPMDSSFGGSYPTDQGYNEFIRGKISQTPDGEYVFITDTPATLPKKVGVFLYTFSQDKIARDIKAIQASISEGTAQ